jgi:hypothetical protein
MAESQPEVLHEDEFEALLTQVAEEVSGAKGSALTSLKEQSEVGSVSGPTAECCPAGPTGSLLGRGCRGWLWMAGGTFSPPQNPPWQAGDDDDGLHDEGDGQ